MNTAHTQHPNNNADKMSKVKKYLTIILISLSSSALLLFLYYKSMRPHNVHLNHVSPDGIPYKIRSGIDYENRYLLQSRNDYIGIQLRNKDSGVLEKSGIFFDSNTFHGMRFNFDLGHGIVQCNAMDRVQKIFYELDDTTYSYIEGEEWDEFPNDEIANFVECVFQSDLEFHYKELSLPKKNFSALLPRSLISDDEDEKYRQEYIDKTDLWMKEYFIFRENLRDCLE